LHCILFLENEYVKERHPLANLSGDELITYQLATFDVHQGSAQIPISILASWINTRRPAQLSHSTRLVDMPM
jgi:hypothetical protein